MRRCRRRLRRQEPRQVPRPPGQGAFHRITPRRHSRPDRENLKKGTPSGRYLSSRMGKKIRQVPSVNYVILRRRVRMVSLAAFKTFEMVLVVSFEG